MQYQIAFQPSLSHFIHLILLFKCPSFWLANTILRYLFSSLLFEISSVRILFLIDSFHDFVSLAATLALGDDVADQDEEEHGG